MINLEGIWWSPVLPIPLAVGLGLSGISVVMPLKY